MKSECQISNLGISHFKNYTELKTDTKTVYSLYFEPMVHKTKGCVAPVKLVYIEGV